MNLRRVALGIGLAVATAPAGGPACSRPAQAIVTIPLEVRVHSSATLAAGDAGAIARRSSQILQIKDSRTDHACQAEFEIESQDGFDHGDGIVKSRYDFDLLFEESGNAASQTTEGTAPSRGRQVRVVREIYWCGGPASVAGCAIGTRIAVARRASDREGELWAHEVGHTKGLRHRDVWVAVMHETILPDHTEVTSLECLAFRR